MGPPNQILGMKNNQAREEEGEVENNKNVPGGCGWGLTKSSRFKCNELTGRMVGIHVKIGDIFAKI
jgi:hypothetical protein